MKPIITVTNIAKKYSLGVRQPSYLSLRDEITNFFSKKPPKRDFWALKDITFEVMPGDVLGIIGANGSGKSTLLKILSRITTPTAGEAVLRGRVSSLLEVGTGFHPELTGRENIFLNGTILGMARREIKNKLDSIVDFSGVEKFLDTPVKHYSSGMYTRLAFAIAAHLEPEILVVDEVLAVGDAEFQKKSLGKMAEIGKGGRTVLFVSHNLGAVGQICGQTLWLENGRIKFMGESREAIKKYLLSSAKRRTVFAQKHNRRKEMNLLKVEIEPEKKEVGNSIFYDEKIKVRIKYEVNNPVTNCTVWFSVQTVDGSMAFTSADFDLDHRYLGHRRPGRYSADIVIPGRWLNIGEYILIVGVVKNSPLIVYDRVEALNFNVVDNGTSPNSIFKEGSRRGIFQPLLEWENEKTG